MAFLSCYGCVLCLVCWGNLAVMLGEVSAHGAELKASAFKESSFFSSLSLADTFPEELEITDYCLELLHDFGQRYSELATCLVSNSRPVKVCQSCYSGYSRFQEIYANISNKVSVSLNICI